MLESIWNGIMAALVFIGIVSLVYILLIHIFKPKKRGKFVVVIPSDADSEDIGSLLYGARMRTALFGDCCCGYTVAVDMGMSQKQRSLCDDICNECGNIIVCNRENLFETLELIQRKD